MDDDSNGARDMTTALSESNGIGRAAQTAQGKSASDTWPIQLR